MDSDDVINYIGVKYLSSIKMIDSFVHNKMAFINSFTNEHLFRFFSEFGMIYEPVSDIIPIDFQF